MISQKKSTTPIENSIKSLREGVPPAVHRAPGAKSLTQKKAIEKLIPHFYVLRKKGCSWEQITNLLNDKCGFRILPSTVRSYFGEMVPKQREICEKRLSDHFWEMKKIKNDQDKSCARQELLVE